LQLINVFRRFAGRFPAILALVFLSVAAAGCSTSETLESARPAAPADPRHAALVVDAASGRVLYADHAEELRYPASLTKMMTIFLMFEAMEEGRLSPATPIPVSANAARQPPSKLGFRAGGVISASSAIDALIVKSANDVAVAVAEHLSGSEDAFAARMTSRARQLGMSSTTFRNASGLPDAAQRTTARDMALLGMALMKRFPQHYHRFSQRSFVHEGKLVRGHNKLLGAVAGVDGIKTGYIRASGFNIVTSAARNGRRVVVVVMGGRTADDRNARVEGLIAGHLSRAGGDRMAAQF
jgi:D-alanyl-D-alanine carboxypeptidase